MWPFRVPQILLLVPSQHTTVVIDEVGDIYQSFVACSPIGVQFNNGTRHNAYVTISGQCLVSRQVSLPLRALFFEVWRIWLPIC